MPIVSAHFRSLRIVNFDQVRLSRCGINCCIGVSVAIGLYTPRPRSITELLIACPAYSTGLWCQTLLSEIGLPYVRVSPDTSSFFGLCPSVRAGFRKSAVCPGFWPNPQVHSNVANCKGVRRHETKKARYSFNTRCQ